MPDVEVFVSWAKKRGLVGSYEELCQNPVGQIPSGVSNQPLITLNTVDLNILNLSSHRT